MTPKDVKHYMHIEQAIRLAERDLDRLRELDEVSDRVIGSLTIYPYTEKHVSVTAHTNSQKIRDAERDIMRLVLLQSSIEAAVKTIEDPTDRLIFTLTMDGKSQSVIARKLNIDQTTVSKRLIKICNMYS